jgi:predicted membrane-bound dolichyl-phosphate-mannose-protein mannosyltransferase
VKLVYWLLLLSAELHFIVAYLIGNKPVSDETYYTVYANDLLRGVASNLEHPPLAKTFIAASIAVLGNDWVAWRLPAILFVLLATYLTYKIALEFLSEKAALFSACVLSLSIVFLYVGSVAFLDMPCLAFGLLGLYLALRSRYVFSGLAFGLSFLCKELGVLLFIATLIYLLIRKVKFGRLLRFSTAMVTLSYVGVWIYDLAYKPIEAGVVLSDALENFYYMVMYQLSLHTLAVPVKSWFPPYGWVSPFGNNALYQGLIQPSVAVEYFMFPLLILLPILYWKRREALALLTWLGLAFTYLPWFIAGLYTHIILNFYVVYSVPFLAIGSAYLWSTVKDRRLKCVCASIQLCAGILWMVCFLVVGIK